MDTSETRVPLQGAAKIFKAELKSKTWDIHGMPQFITTTHCEGCDMCKAYALHVEEALTSMDANPDMYPILIPPALNTFYFCHHPQPHHSQPYHAQSIIYHPSFVITGNSQY